MVEPPVPETAEQCARRIRELYGAELPTDAGVLHVTSVWQPPDGAAVTLAIHPGSPKSATDRFVLGLARARADAIVTSGQVLRAEPTVDHRTGVPALDAWRREVLGREGPTLSVVLTASGEVDLEHPLFRGRAVIVTGTAVAERLVPPAAKAGVEVVGRARPGPRDTVEWLRAERGARTITIELGAASSRSLYDAPSVVDELLLSSYLEPELPERDRAAPFLPPDRLAALFAPPTETPSLEESGRWLFRRYLRSPN